MKILIGIIAVIILAIILYGKTNKDAEISKYMGKLEDIEENIKKLMAGNNAHGFLVIEVVETEDFIQFSGNDKGVQLDFPLVTKRQKELEIQFRECAKELNLQVIENKGTDGAIFLDIDLNGSPIEIAKAVKGMMTKIFGVGQNSALQFQLDI